MIAASPEHAVELLDRAFEQKDIETLVSLYEEAAVVVSEPGKTVRGTAELHNFFEAIAKLGGSARQLKTCTFEADGIALFLSRWVYSSLTPDGQKTDRTLVATTVFRKQADGGWKALIDNSFGPLVLDVE